METASETSRDVPLLTANEARLLGCLIEKEATTPDSYPLTVNAAQSAANQKTARDPVTSLDTGEVNHTLRQLEQKALARQVFSTRAERYEHRTGTYFGLPKQQVVLLGLLLLRGPQTAPELLARSERLFKFADLEDIRHHLDRLIQRQSALAIQIPRGPGQREDRYMHLLTGPVDVEAIAARSSAGSAAGAASPELEERLQALEAEMAELREQLAQLRTRLGE
ncbi:YceH family protein [Pseudoxanthomonas sp. UTMC 1351]|uniref:YceH family protein n=1 Tax=Pseudoxanthomonas sp. UTMC 1351 TaxID=2695853 RepID=UPI0034CEE746